MSKYTLAKSIFVAGSSFVAGAKEDNNESLNLRGSGRDLYLVNVAPPPTPSPLDNFNNGWLHDGFDRIDTPAPTPWATTYMPTTASDINDGWGGDAHYGSVSGGTIHYSGTYVTEGSGFHGSGSASVSSGKSGKGSSSSGSGKSGKGGASYSGGKSGNGSHNYNGGKSSKGSSNYSDGKSGKGSSSSGVSVSGSGSHGVYWSGSASVIVGKGGNGSSNSFSGGKSGKSGSNPINPTYPIVEQTWYSDGYARTRGKRINDGSPAAIATPEQIGDRPRSTFKSDETVDCREITAGHPAVCVKVCTTIKSVFDGSTLVDESATTTESECD